MLSTGTASRVDVAGSSDVVSAAVLDVDVVVDVDVVDVDVVVNVVVIFVVTLIEVCIAVDV